MIVDGGISAVKGAKALNTLRLAKLERQAAQVAIKEAAGIEGGAKNVLRGALDVEEYSSAGKLFGQETANTCVAASCRMVLDDLGVTASESQIASTLPINIDGVGIQHVPSALEKFGVEGAKFNAGSQIVDLEQALANGNKVIAGTNIPGMGPHAMVVDAIQDGKVFLRNPSPVGIGDSLGLKIKDFQDIWKSGRNVVIPSKR
jgi:ABC-type bacteriocin/lantibiotic exporter with double-glycine peptidase domain